MIINGVNMPDEKDKRSKMIFDALKGENLSDGLYEQIGGWLASEDNTEEKEARMREYFDSTFEYEAEPRPVTLEKLAEFEKLYGFPTGRKPVKKIALRRRVMFKVAAVLIPAMVIAGSVFMLVERANDVVKQNPVATVTVSVPADGFDPAVNGSKGEAQNSNTVMRVAENSVVTLPDNSTVRLTKGSEIRHMETFGNGRAVELYGKAHFNVTKALNEDDNFTVHTEHFKISVLGTEFTVHSPAGESYSTIDLLHGSVEVEAAGKRYLMTPAQHLHFDHQTKEAVITRMSPRKLVYDEMPGMVFSKTPISEVLARLENDFGVALRIIGTIPASEYDVNGDMVGATSPDELLRTLQRLSGNQFTYEITDEEIIVTINNI